MSSGSRLRVCLFTQQFGHLWSGVGSYSNDLVQQLPKFGCDVSVVAPPVARIPEGDYRHIPVRPSKLDPTPGGWVSLSRAYRNRLMRGELIDPTEFDVLHFLDAREALCLPEGMPPAIGTVHDCYAAEARGNPFYYRKHYGDGFRRYAYYHITRSLEGRAYRKLTKIIANSCFVGRALERAFELPARSIDVVEMGVAPPERLAAAQPLLDGDPSILFVGSNFFRKGLPALARATALLARSEFPHIKVHVVGRDRNLPEMEKLLQLLGISDRFHFHGWLDRARTRELYPRVEVTCVPSLVEAFGLVYLESMMAGTPVIAGNVGGTVEFIRHGVNGILVPPEDPERIARYLLELRRCPKFRLDMVAKGRATAVGFGSERMASRTVDLYRRVAGENGWLPTLTQPRSEESEPEEVTSDH